ncbi:hypothetical protein Q7P37_000435 [Cladosporium fusiforme]
MALHTLHGGMYQICLEKSYFHSSYLMRELDKALDSLGLNTHKDQYDAVFWCQANTAPGLTDSYIKMAMTLGVANSPDDHHLVITRGRNWLQETDKRWLLVFDNIVNWEDISRYIPGLFRRSSGSILITTPNERLLALAANTTMIRINPLNQKSGSKMLLKYLGRDVENDPERHLAREISVFVGGLPVAIAHVAGYVDYSGYSLEELIETFREWRKRAGVATDEADDLPATFREASFSYEGALTMVWEVTLRELTQDARDVLNILACLNCASVPKDMIWSMHADPILRFLDPREKIRMRRIHQSLTKRRLVVESDGCFSMHRSLQRGIRDRLSQDKGQQQTVFDQAVAIVREVFPLPNELQQPTPDRWSERQKLLPHLHALHEIYHESQHQITGSAEFAQILLDAGMDQFEQGVVHEGLLLLHTAEEVLEAADGPYSDGHQVMKANIHAMIAIMYDDVGIVKRQEAMDRRQMALEIRKEIFENSPTKSRNDEILLYNSWMEYAISLLHYHRYMEAEPIIDKCLAKFREWDPEDKIPFEYAKYYNKIALVRMYQGRFDEAIDLATKDVKLMSKTGYHLFTSRFKFDQACIMLQSGDPERALHIHEEIHEQRIETVGPVNPLSLHSMYAIGAINELKEDFYEAENWFRKVLDQRRALTSWPDEAHSRTQFHLAKVLQAQGRPEDVDEVATLRDSALETLHRLLPLDFPQELRSVTDEAILFDHMLPISPGGPRFTGKGLLERFVQKASTEDVLPVVS